MKIQNIKSTNSNYQFLFYTLNKTSVMLLNILTLLFDT